MTDRAARVRLDQLLVQRGHAASRERARALILAGHVTLPGTTSSPKPGHLVREDADVQVRQADHPYVGRGALKLVHALDTFGIAVEGREALDIGASTGGFTDVLLRRGAAHVVALDVGHNQMDWRLRSDPRVSCLERINARHLVPADLPEGHRAFDIVTADVSFISLRYILPVVPPLLRPGADVVTLVKPQFEAGRDEVGKHGIVRDEAVRARVLAEVVATAAALGLDVQAHAASPIEGMEGNREWLAHFRSRA
ncbi:TlyA family rRNA (cytidine-2'-O)-methyltransferase [Luteitalea sp. TBR-22]|uniref:TlyA family RNA methyltransferase n=1 Tax=Luteitalea sp. TBR-22 TaxID=2802971 RepID=UPI001AF33B46|nr:TlyA family RNA methyltransferase [Luteitalea sp. TBR-22]BCS32727.1 TlyA family rRNA (cytidine-2'-O)-methyltransferase [Luteitalea sp. TBR-22]